MQVNATAVAAMIYTKKKKKNKHTNNNNKRNLTQKTEIQKSNQLAILG